MFSIRADGAYARGRQYLHHLRLDGPRVNLFASTAKSFKDGTQLREPAIMKGNEVDETIGYESIIDTLL